MRSLLIALVLLTLPFPLLAWTSTAIIEGAKGIKSIDPFGKEQVIFVFSPKLTAESRPPIFSLPASVAFFPSRGKCNPFQYQPDKSVKVQGTMVRMIASCPNSGNGLSVSPLSKAGQKYVFNMFKTRNQVIVEADGDLFCGNSSTGSCMFKIDTSDFNVITEESFSGGI